MLKSQHKCKIALSKTEQLQYMVQSQTPHDHQYPHYYMLTIMTLGIPSHQEQVCMLKQLNLIALFEILC